METETTLKSDADAYFFRNMSPEEIRRAAERGPDKKNNFPSCGGGGGKISPLESIVVCTLRAGEAVTTSSLA